MDKRPITGIDDEDDPGALAMAPSGVPAMLFVADDGGNRDGEADVGRAASGGGGEDDDDDKVCVSKCVTDREMGECAIPAGRSDKEADELRIAWNEVNDTAGDSDDTDDADDNDDNDDDDDDSQSGGGTSEASALLLDAAELFAFDEDWRPRRRWTGAM